MLCSLSGSGLVFALAGAQYGWSMRRSRLVQTAGLTLPLTLCELSTTMVRPKALSGPTYSDSGLLLCHHFMKSLDGQHRHCSVP